MVSIWSEPETGIFNTTSIYVSSTQLLTMLCSFTLAQIQQRQSEEELHLKTGK